MLTRPIAGALDSVFLRVSGGDTIRADELRARASASFLAFIMVSYIPLLAGVVLLVMNRPHATDTAAEQDQFTAVKSYATRYVDAYLKDPSNSTAIQRGHQPPDKEVR